MIKITGKLIKCERFDTSRNGNPRYYCLIQDSAAPGSITSFYTGVDSSHGYSITNHEVHDITVELKMNRGKLTLQCIEWKRSVY